MKIPDKKIKSLDELVKQKVSVWVQCWDRPSPMAFIWGLPLRVVKHYIDQGYFYTIKDVDDLKKVVV